jgi:perosamine synthetase
MTGIASERIPLFRPLIEPEALTAVKEAFESGWLGLGPRSETFERAFADYIGVPHCVGTSSCSAAIQLALRSLDLPPESEVITTALTFVASNQIILHERLRPVFADVDPTTGNLDPASVAARMSDKTGALLLVHYGGYPCDLDELYRLARDREVPVIEDCAHACGAVYRGRRIGSHGQLHAFSFHAIKNLPMGEGGALTLGDGERDRRLRKLRWFGIDADSRNRFSADGYRWDYSVCELGYKHYLDDLHASIGLVQLGALDAGNARRAEIAARYRSRLIEVAGIELLREEPDRESSYHLMCVLADERDALIRRLAERGVDTGVHYRPSYYYPMFEGEALPGVESFWRRAVSLPMHLHLTDEQIERIVTTIAEGW